MQINYKLALLMQIFYKISETEDRRLYPTVENKIELECYGEKVETELIGLSLDSRDIPILEYKDEFTDGNIGYDPLEIIGIDGIKEIMRAFGIRTDVAVPVFLSMAKIEMDINND